MIAHIQGFILKIEDFRENDKIASIYTDQFGKIKVLIRGAKRLTSKLAGQCQPFILLNLTISSGRFWWHLIGLETRQVFLNIWQERLKLEVGTKILIAVDDYLRPEKKDIKIFKLIFSALTVLNLISAEKARLILDSFLLKLIKLLGYQPNLKNCVFCQGKRHDQLKFFHLAKGGLTCATCQNKFGGAVPISWGAFKILSQMAEEKLAFWLKVSLPDERSICEAEKMINQFISWHLT